MMPSLIKNAGSCIPAPYEEKISMTTWLKTEKERLEGRLLEINETLKAMEDNPHIAEVIDKISKLSF